MLAVDSPTLSFEMLELFESAGVPPLVAGYLGEPALISVQKTTLRKAEPSVPGAWHQDGAFMGEVRSLNLWLALSRCGDVAPGLDIVPRRLDEFAPTGTDEAMLSYQVSQRRPRPPPGACRSSGPSSSRATRSSSTRCACTRPASDPSMPNPRFAIENWFFGGLGVPARVLPRRRLVAARPVLATTQTAGACRWRSRRS